MAPFKAPFIPLSSLANMATKSKNETKTPASAPWVMAPEQIVREIHTLSDELDLTPPQAAAVLQTTEDQLKTMREVGDGPPFGKLGDGKNAPVRYQLGGVRKWRAAHTFQNTASVQVCRFAGMPDFLSTGAIDDIFIVAMDANGRQWDLWESIKQQADIVEVVWQPMDEILEGFRRSGNRRFADKEAEELSAGPAKGKVGGRKPPL